MGLRHGWQRHGGRRRRGRGGRERDWRLVAKQGFDQALLRDLGDANIAAQRRRKVHVDIFDARGGALPDIALLRMFEIWNGAVLVVRDKDKNIIRASKYHAMDMMRFLWCWAARIGRIAPAPISQVIFDKVEECQLAGSRLASRALGITDADSFERKRQRLQAATDAVPPPPPPSPPPPPLSPPPLATPEAAQEPRAAPALCIAAYRESANACNGLTPMREPLPPPPPVTSEAAHFYTAFVLCDTCQRHVRKDNLARHARSSRCRPWGSVGLGGKKLQCSFCGREYFGTQWKRHLASQICKAARAQGNIVFDAADSD